MRLDAKKSETKDTLVPIDWTLEKKVFKLWVPFCILKE
jgi:hypothetical protein